MVSFADFCSGRCYDQDRDPIAPPGIPQKPEEVEPVKPIKELAEGNTDDRK